MRIALVNPPLGSITQPFLALASLQGHLRREGYQDVCLHDVSQQVVCRILSRSYLEDVTGCLDRTVDRLESQPTLDLFDALRLEKVTFGRAAAWAALPRIEAALDTLRDPVRFYQVDAYREAMEVVDQTFEAVSAAHFPQVITRTSYSASTIEDLDDRAELTRFLETPERCLFHAEYQNGVVDRIAADRPDLIGLSATFAAQFLPALVLAHNLRSRLPAAHIVLGGAFVTARLAEILARPWLFEALDSMIVFEGETALVELIKRLEAGAPLAGSPNLIRAVKDRVIPPECRHTESLEDLGPPDYAGYDIASYLSPTFDVLYDPTRGCYWGKCTFCAISLSTRGGMDRRRRVDAVVDDLELLCRRHLTDVVTFGVDAIPVDFMRAVAEELVRRRSGIRWSSEFTLDKDLDRSTLDTFAASGCLMLMFGVESASPRVLRLMKKGTLADRTERIIKDCREAGIGVLLHLMVGYPGETAAELEETILFVEQMRSWVDLYELSPFGLVDDTPLAAHPAEFGIARVGPIHRAFNPRAVRAWDLVDGGRSVNLMPRVAALRNRLDRALELAGRRHLRQDGAHLHLYLRVTGQRPRQFAPATPLASEQPVLVRSRYDLVSLFSQVGAIRRRRDDELEASDRTSADFWSEHASRRFHPDGPFVGHLWERRGSIARIAQPTSAAEAVRGPSGDPH